MCKNISNREWMEHDKELKNQERAAYTAFLMILVAFIVVVSIILVLNPSLVLNLIEKMFF